VGIIGGLFGAIAFQIIISTTQFNSAYVIWNCFDLIAFEIPTAVIIGLMGVLCVLVANRAALTRVRLLRAVIIGIGGFIGTGFPIWVIWNLFPLTGEKWAVSFLAGIAWGFVFGFVGFRSMSEKTSNSVEG
jgi:xanthosine utilization system XapX-like protein